MQILRGLAKVPPKSKTTPKPIYSRPTVTRVTKVTPSTSMAAKMIKVRVAKRINQMQTLRGLAKLPPKSKPKSKEKPKGNLIKLIRKAYRSKIPKSQRGRKIPIHPSGKLRYNNVFLEKLYKASGKKRKALIARATPEQINTINEIVLNILRGHINIKEKDKKRISKFKDQLRDLASKGVSFEKKKKILNQHGGSMAAVAIADAALSNVQQYNREYNSFCTKEKLAAGEECVFAPEDYNTKAYRREHSDTVKCVIL